MTTEHLDFWPEGVPSFKDEVKKMSAVPAVTEDDPTSVKRSVFAIEAPKNIKSWGVKDRAGEWVEVTDSPWYAPHAAKNLTKTAALDIFKRYEAAYQLIDGCDCWACLLNKEEVLVVVQQRDEAPS
jgi:hypothetical protein